MRAVVVFESVFGNTRAVARAVADGLSSRLDVTVKKVGEAPADLDDDVALLVVGAPTHAFVMSRPGTLRDAENQTKQGQGSCEVGLREWLAAVRPGSVSAGAAFDTRIRRPRLPGPATPAAEKGLRRLGLHAIAPAESFYVEGTLGPLLDGEQERARRWGEQLGSAVLSAQACRRVS